MASGKVKEKKVSAKKDRVKTPVPPEILEQRKKIAGKVSGLVTGAFALFTVLAIVSYLFTWKTDYSLLSDPGMLDKDVSVANIAGKLGYKWAHFLVSRCFGLGSFAIAVLLVMASARLFSLKPHKKLLRLLGGDCGKVLTAGIVNLTGRIVTFIVLLILIVVWLLSVSGRFSRWLSHLGDKKPVPEPVPGDGKTKEKEVSDDESVLTGDSDGEIIEDGDSVEDNSIDDEGNSIEDDSFAGKSEEPGPDSEDDTEPENRVSVSREAAVQNGQDGGIEVVKGEELSTDVKKELPRIDVREELENYKFPSLDLLKDYASKRYEVATEELERNNNKIRATLLSYKIQVEKVTACVGPTVTLYKVVPAPGVKISAIKTLDQDIAMSLNAKGVRVVALSDSVGIEVANDRPSIVPLKSMLNDDAFRNSKAELPVAIGYTITQKVKVFDLADAPHLLIAGATKQGKSVCLNVIITSLLYAKHPSELKFVFIDPKMVEFTAYSKLLKHFLAVLPDAADDKEEMENAVVKKPKQAEEILRSLCIEMDERFALFSKAGVNELKLYNDKYRDRKLLPTDGHRFMPYMVVVIDEYADLIMSGPMGGDSKSMARSITTSIIRLAQKGRAAGIHVIIATQRPSVDVITGLIKTNFPTRIAFRVSTRVDSSTIIDSPGAERLIGKGDMLYYAGVDSERAQCALVDLEEINAVTNFIASQTGYKKSYNTPYYLPSVNNDDGSGGGMINMQDLDEMFEEAAKLVVTTQQGSTSNLQRRLGFGYARAGKVMDQLEAAGIVGPQEGSKPRQVLIPDLASLEPVLKAFMN